MSRLAALLVTCLAAAPPQIQQYRVERLVGGVAAHGLHGVAVDSQGALYASSVAGQTIYRVDEESGDLEPFVRAPDGMADDMVFGPGGILVWVAAHSGEVRAKEPDEPVRVIARDLPGVSALAFRGDGLLFAAQSVGADALWEIDVDGKEPPRLVRSELGGLGGFDFASDGKLYGALPQAGQVVRVDVQGGDMDVVAEGLHTPVAARFDSLGGLYVLGGDDGRVWKLDAESGAKRRIATLAPGLARMAFDARDRLFATQPGASALYELEPGGRARKLRSAPLSLPGDLALAAEASKPVLLVADDFALRAIDVRKARVRDVATPTTKGFERPTGVTAGKRFTWWTSWHSGAVQKADRSSGRILRTWHGFERPVDVAELPDGDALVLEAAGRLLRVSSAEGDERHVVTEELHAPVALALADEGHALVTEWGSGTLARIDLESGAREVVADALRGPEGVAIGPDGRIYLVEVAARRVISFEPDGEGRSLIASKLPVGLPAPPGAPGAFVTSGIAVDANGVVYLSADLEDAIYRLIPE